jgi:hypothetical protein
MGKQSCLLFSRYWLLWCITKLFIMADISMCPGTDCPVKEKCYRFTAPKSEYGQSYFFEAPGETEDDKFTCDMYWGENSESIWNHLKDITNGKDNS